VIAAAVEREVPPADAIIGAPQPKATAWPAVEVLGIATPLLSVAAPAITLPLAKLNVVPCITTLVEPRGTPVVGETMVWLPAPSPNVPSVPTEMEPCDVATPPIVMLLEAIVLDDVNPKPSTRTEVGDVPMKLNCVPPALLT